MNPTGQIFWREVTESYPGSKRCHYHQITDSSEVLIHTH
jgi:hypothetical protein